MRWPDFGFRPSLVAPEGGKEIERIRWYAEDAVAKLKRHATDIRQREEQGRQSAAEAWAITQVIAGAAMGEVAPSSPDPDPVAAVRTAASKAESVPATGRGIGELREQVAKALFNKGASIARVARSPSP